MSGHRRSSIGEFNVGDTQGAALGTSETGDIRSRRRQASLSGQPEGKESTSSGSKHSKKSDKQKPQLRPAGGLERKRLQALEFAHQYPYSIPATLFSLVLIPWCLVARNDPGHWLNALVKLSYPIEGTLPIQYGKGPRDFAFVLYYTIGFTFVREFTMQVFLKPIARSFGITGKHKTNRFLEQTYSMIYYGVSGPVGLYIMYNSSMWYFDSTGFYEGYPHRSHNAPFKAFYLLQAAFWSQQALVLGLNLEKRRKDFRELVFHHLLTIALIFLSYRFHFTHMGLAIYITMDVSDFFLATSKTLNYLESSLVAPFFIFFVGTWIYFRHYLNLVILWSILTDFETVGPFILNWETQQYKCWISQYITFALLAALQLVNVYWLVLILRILYRYVTLNVAEDVRSDDEESDEE